MAVNQSLIYVEPSPNATIRKGLKTWQSIIVQYRYRFMNRKWNRYWKSRVEVWLGTIEGKFRIGSKNLFVRRVMARSWHCRDKEIIRLNTCMRHRLIILFLIKAVDKMRKKKYKGSSKICGQYVSYNYSCDLFNSNNLI